MLHLLLESRFVNDHFCNVFKTDRINIIEKNDYAIFAPVVAKQLQENDKRIMISKTAEFLEESGEMHGKIITYQANKVPLIDSEGVVYGICGVSFDITAQKEMEKEHKIIYQKLQKAFKEIKTLKGLIPICAYCKKNRDSDGVWDIMEAYITKHSDAKFSH